MSTELQRANGELPALRNDDVLSVIAAAARDPQVDPAKLTALLQLKERVDARNAEVEFNRAFARLMIRMPRVKKNGTVSLRNKEGQDKGSIPFAKWEDVDRVVRPMLSEEGFALSFTCTPSVGCVEMTGILTHIQGHRITSTMQLPPDVGPGRNALQAIGSSHSYGKRYITLDLLNIVTEGADDDGNSAGCINGEQASIIEGMIMACQLDDAARAAFLHYAGADEVSLIQKYRFLDCMSMLRKRLRKSQESPSA